MLATVSEKPWHKRGTETVTPGEYTAFSVPSMLRYLKRWMASRGRMQDARSRPPVLVEVNGDEVGVCVQGRPATGIVYALARLGVQWFDGSNDT